MTMGTAFCDAPKKEAEAKVDYAQLRKDIVWICLVPDVVFPSE